MSLNTLANDSCSYQEKLRRSVGPGMYMLNTPASDELSCSQDIPADPSLRFQTYGPNTCVPGHSIDDSSELKGLSYKNSKCSGDYYVPGKYSSKGLCGVPGKTPARACVAPQESTRLSNPPCTLHGTGWNRWEWLCYDPQVKAIVPFEYNVDAGMLMRDNHVPCLEKPMDESELLPNPVEMSPTYYTLKSCNDGYGGIDGSSGQRFGGMSTRHELVQL